MKFFEIREGWGWEMERVPSHKLSCLFRTLKLKTDTKFIPQQLFNSFKKAKL